MERLKKTIGKFSGGKILDVGTGGGYFIPVIRDSFQKFSEIIGIDTKESSLEIARKEFKEENIKFMNMSAEKIEFENNSMDALKNKLYPIGFFGATELMIVGRKI